MRHERSTPPWLLKVAITLLLLVNPWTLWGQQQVRVASYNIKFLNTTVNTQGDRLQKLREVIELLDADVIGLQEIDNRAALELVFPPSDWQIIIDDDSGEVRDPAVVVRRPFIVRGFDAILDADDQPFLFPGTQNNQFFPNRRDVLFAEVQVPDSSATFFVLVAHAKSRVGGRAQTDSRRHERDFILLGQVSYDAAQVQPGVVIIFQ